MPQRIWLAAQVLAKITSVMPGILYVFNAVTRSNEYSNRSMAEILGYSSDEITAMGDTLIADLCHPDDVARIGAHLAAVSSLEDGEVRSLEYRMRNRDGHWVWLLSNDMVFERDETGTVVRHIGVATDISFQKRNEEQVAAARDELETVFNAVSSGIIALDEDGMIVRINTRARLLLGLESETLPMPWPESAAFLDPETMTPLVASADPIRRALAGHDLRGETHLMRAGPSGQNRYIRISNARPAQTGRGIHTVLDLDEVTEEVRDRQVIERKGRLDALGQLTGGIAHDFNNLLGAMLYSVDLAGRARSDEERGRHLATAMQSIERGTALTTRLLAFARRQPGLASVRVTEEVFEDFRKLVRPVIEAQFEISFEVTEPGLRHLCDPAQLETALMNLVLNARDAMLRSGKGNHIKIKARPVSTRTPAAQHQDQPALGSSLRYVEISVSDNGPGMDAVTLARCTDPFFSTKGAGGGTGLGLAIVYGFTTQSNGDFRIYSEEGVGTTVRMTLPRGSAEGFREETVPAAPVETGRGETILVVEDEYLLLGPMTDLLETLDYEVVPATSGDQAIELIESGLNFDLLITDVVMPGSFGGFELARRVRAKRADVPVIYLSGYTGFTASEMGEISAPLLQKPAPANELARAISSALRARDGGAGP